MFSPSKHMFVHGCARDRWVDRYSTLEGLSCSSLSLQVHELIMCVCVCDDTVGVLRYVLSSGGFMEAESLTWRHPAGLTAPVSYLHLST